MSEALLAKKIKNPEINQSISEFNDTTTLLAEVLDGQMRSRFEYSLHDQELYAEGCEPLGPIFDKAISDAETKTQHDSRYNFELRRRRIERDEYQQMVLMANNQTDFNTMVMVSDFPPEVDALGDDFGGYNHLRRQTMLRIITKSQTGKIVMTQQSLDLSDRVSLEAIYDYMGVSCQPGELLGQRITASLDEPFQNNLADALMRVYDAKLTMVRGGQWHAGRNVNDKRNTLEFARRQTDLINAYLISDRSDDKTYKLSAAITARFEAKSTPNIDKLVPLIGRIGLSQAIYEMEYFGRLAQNAGQKFNGCGATLKMSSEASLAIMGYGDTDKKYDKQDWYGAYKKKGVCVNCKVSGEVGEKSWCKGCIKGHCGK